MGTWGNLGETRGGVGKSDVLEHKSGNISEHVKNRGKVTMAYRNSPMLFRVVQFPIPYAPISLDWRFATPTQNFQSAYYLRNGT